MSITLGAVITAIRDRNPFFHKTRVTDAVLARFLSDWQNELIGKAVRRDAGYLAQSIGIALDLDAANAPGTVGAGTSGGLPADVVDDAIEISEETAGGLVFPLTSTDEGGVVVVAERAATAATANTISSTGAGRTVNADVGRLVHITGGKGAGQIREVASNLAAQWTVTDNWDTTPNATSLFTIITESLSADETLGVVTALPSLSTRSGYLVRISAQGVPYVDYTEPLAVTLDRGVPLPSLLAPLGGTVRYSNSDADPLSLISYAQRFEAARTPAAYVQSGVLYLCGSAQDWNDVVSIELRYVPLAPVFTALTDYFLILDGARPAAVAAGAAFAALRIDGVEGISVNTSAFEEKSMSAEREYLKSVRLVKRARSSYFREA